MKNKTIDHTRRDFLKASSIVGTGLVVGIHLPNCSAKGESSLSKVKKSEDELEPNAWIKIRKDNTITFVVSHSEMGQGISTTLCMIIAEELEADWPKVNFEMAPVADIYKHPHYGIQWTVSSMSVHSSWDRWRKAGASTRQLLILAAARFWNVPHRECRAEKSTVIHHTTGKTITYGELTDKTHGIEIPENVSLKQPHEFKIIGKSTLRLDNLSKIDGTAVFGIDVNVPDMLIAIVVHPPVFGTTAKSFRAEKALKMPGVHKVLSIEAGIAIVADTFWQARKAINALEVTWEENENNQVSSRRLFERWHKLGKEEGKVLYETGNMEKVFEKPAKPIETTYDLPYQAHATPEPMNCTAYVADDYCEVWAPTQNPEGAQEMAAKISGFDQDQIKVHTTFLGCGFGRRALVDYVGEAVEISKKMNVPIKVIWTREEDIRHDRFRAANHNVMKAVLDKNGLPVAWLHHIVGSDIFSYATPKILPAILPDFLPQMVKNAISSLAEVAAPRLIAGKKALKGAGPLPYNIPNVQVQFTNNDPGIPQCWWRSVAPSTNCFAVECFIDDLAHAGGKDPYELRVELLKDNPRLKKVVETLASEAKWYDPPSSGIYRGMAAHNFQSTMMACVAEVSVNEFQEIKVHRVICAVDCGIAINPKNIEAQVQSAFVFGLTATIKSSITFKDGKTEQSNFDDFPLLRMNEMPHVEVHIIPSTDPPTGIGEAGVPIIGPAVANAVFAATGKRLRKLPLDLSEA